MAANKFATMLHRNTNKITLILVYAVLEWILIFFLLLNSLFSYLIIKYAEYFGLKRPCLWCSRLDHFLDSKKNNTSYRDLVCDDHAREISKLGFCSNHRKLSESHDMCEDCSSSSQPELSKDYAFFPWMKQIGLIQGAGEVSVENGEMNSKCSCCGVKLEKNLYPPYLLLKPSWEVLDYTQKGNLVKENDEENGIDDDDGDHSDHSRSELVFNQPEDVQRAEENKEILIEGTELEAEENCSGSVSNADCKEMVTNEDEEVAAVVEKEQETIKEEHLNVLITDPSSDQGENQVKKEASPETAARHLEFYIDGDFCNLIPIELIDPRKAAEKKSGYKFREKDQGNCGNEDVILDFTLHDVVPLAKLLPILENEEEEIRAAEAELESLELNENEWSSFMQAEVRESIEEEEQEQIAVEQRTEIPSTDEKDDAQASAATATEDTEADANQVSDEMDAEVSIGTDIPDHEPIDDIQIQEDLPSYPLTEEGVFASSSEFQADNADDHGYKQSEDDVEFKTIAVKTSEEASNSHLSSTSEVNENEEEKVPDTPTSIDSLHQLHKKLLLLDRRESGTEESLDGGSVISDIDAADGVLTVEKLKSALRAERKALNVLYTELEEERSASAIAANQTMAMINRLQEEKAAMQMEALQYQRMMEEQSEYDQEALQLLNELMVKREKEKAEIEKELEIYRKKVQDYEAKEKLQMLRRRSRTSSASCSNAEDSDGLSIDLNHEVKEEDGFDNNPESNNQNTPAEAVLYLQESLANFEEERLLILEQLKVLEEKLFTLNDEEEDQNFEDIHQLIISTKRTAMAATMRIMIPMVLQQQMVISKK
ncbi:Myosin-binding protein [Melia azedarach]|uniref:Myosin-binding protein n=1 Tax=Melia azedarach TaxID=155640 RepID=A0ACC1XFF0_MELAZ|nr:Myosin-binding protein [Melia azedarach]